MLATYRWRMRNNNLEIRIAGSSCRPQLTQLTQLILRDTRLENVQDLESFMRGPALWGQFCSRRLLSLDRK